MTTAAQKIADELFELGCDLNRVQLEATLRPNQLRAIDLKFNESELLSIGAAALQHLISERVDSVERQIWMSIRDKAMAQMEAM